MQDSPTPRESAAWIRQQVVTHTEWFNDSLPMIASENLVSPLARELMISDFADRYAEGLPGKRYYQGNIYVDNVEERVMELAKTLYRCAHADVRPISGTVANMSVLKVLVEPGDVITAPALQAGAHISTAKFGAVGMRGVTKKDLPFDPHEMNLDIDGAAKVIRKEKPKLCLFGRSVFLFPAPLRELAPVAAEVGAPVWYDGAHVMGLIGGGQFQDPFREGAWVMTGSTHKTLPGPQHAMVLANPPEGNADLAADSDEWRKFCAKLYRGVFPGVTSNHHLHTMAALGVALAEHTEYGQQYAKQIIANAQALGAALCERGFAVLAEHKGFTASHTLAIDVAKQGGGRDVSLWMEQANMISNMNMLPHDDPRKPMNPSGIRLGSQELTRLGMKEDQMQDVAQFIKRVAIDKEDPKKVGRDVAEFKKDFNTLHYCFTEGYPAYQFHELV